MSKYRKSISLSSVVMEEEHVQIYPEASVSTVVEMIAVEIRQEIIAEEITVLKEDKRTPRQIILEQKLPAQPLRERDDDWFVLLDGVSRELSYLPTAGTECLPSRPPLIISLPIPPNKPNLKDYLV